MALKPKISVSIGSPECNTITVCDITCAYNANTCKGGYGSPNPEISDITKTLLYMTPPNSTIAVKIDSGFLPSDEGCNNNGCFDITCDDYFIALGDVDQEDLVDAPDNEPCGCGGLGLNPPLSINTNSETGCFVDGCWQFTYQEFIAGETAVYDVTAITFPAAFTIVIDGNTNNLGAPASLVDLLNSLNTLGLGIFTAAGTIISVTGAHTYGDMNSGGVIAPTVSDVDVLVGSVTEKVFLSCQIANRIKKIGVTVFSTDCNCKGENVQELFNSLMNDYQSMLITAKDHSCNCTCAGGYLDKLTKKVKAFENQCND